MLTARLEMLAALVANCSVLRVSVRYCSDGEQHAIINVLPAPTRLWMQHTTHAWSEWGSVGHTHR